MITVINSFIEHHTQHTPYAFTPIEKLANSINLYYEDCLASSIRVVFDKYTIVEYIVALIGEPIYIKYFDAHGYINMRASYNNAVKNGDYLTTQEIIFQFLDSNTIPTPGSTIRRDDLYKNFRKWFEQTNYQINIQKQKVLTLLSEYFEQKHDVFNGYKYCVNPHPKYSCLVTPRPYGTQLFTKTVISKSNVSVHMNKTIQRAILSQYYAFQAHDNKPSCFNETTELKRKFAVFSRNVFYNILHCNFDVSDERHVDTEVLSDNYDIKTVMRNQYRIARNTILRDQIHGDIDWKNNILKLTALSLDHDEFNIVCDKLDIESTVKLFKPIEKLVTDIFDTDSDNVIIQPLIMHQNFQLIPDCIICDTIVEIAEQFTTDDYTEYLLRLMLMFCILKNKGDEIKNVAIVIPSQNHVVMFDLEKWYTVQRGGMLIQLITNVLVESKNPIMLRKITGQSMIFDKLVSELNKNHFPRDIHLTEYHGDKENDIILKNKVIEVTSD